MELEYSLRPEDFRAFARYHRKLPCGQPTFSLLAVLGVVGIVLAWGLALMVAAFFFEEKSIIVGMLIGWLWVTLLLSWSQGCRIRSIYAAKCEDPHSEWAVRAVRVVISPDRLRTFTRGSISTYDWQIVWHIGVTDKHVFLCLTRDTAIVVPRRSFHDGTHFEEFLALARQYQHVRAQQKPKSTGIITGLPPQTGAFTRPDVT